MSKKTLVIGASLNPQRYSNIAMKRLVNSGHQVVAFGLKQGQVGHVKIDMVLYPYEQIDTVTLYLNPERQKAYYEYVMGLHPQRIIFNPGTENIEFQELLKERNIYFEEACTLVLLSTNQY